jgi:hypothetical protein
MVTWNIPQRFTTASKALGFFEESVLPHTTEEQLQQQPVKCQAQGDRVFMTPCVYDQEGL